MSDWYTLQAVKNLRALAKLQRETIGLPELNKIRAREAEIIESGCTNVLSTQPDPDTLPSVEELYPVSLRIEAQLRLIHSAMDDAKSAQMLAASMYTDFSKRIAIIMTVRVLEVHAVTTQHALVALQASGVSVDPKTLELLGRRDKLIERVRESFKESCRLRSPLKLPKFVSHGWQAVTEIVKVRHRLIHPASEEDVHVSDEELLAAQRAGQWLNDAYESPKPE